MANLKSLIAGAGLSVMLASGALAFTPVSGEVLRPEGAPKSAPTWMEFTPERNDTLYGACTSFLAAAGLADKYGWTDCAGVVVKQNGQEKFLPGFKLRQDTNYLFPVAVNPTTGQVQTSPAAVAPAVSGAQMAADIATLREIIDGNLPAMAEAIRGNTARIDEQSARVDDNARSIDELASWAESNTQAVAENRQLIGQNATAAAEAKSLAEQASADAKAAQATADDAKAESATALGVANDASSQAADLSSRFNGLEGQVAANTAAASRSNWALMAAAGAALAALLVIVIATLRHRKLPKVVAGYGERLDNVATTAQQATEAAEAADVKASSALQTQTGLGIDWDNTQLPDLKAMQPGDSLDATLKVDGQEARVTFTKRDDGRVDWNVLTKDGAARQPLVKLSEAAVQHKLNTAYDDGCLETLKQPSPVSAMAA